MRFCLYKVSGIPTVCYFCVTITKLSNYCACGGQVGRGLAKLCQAAVLLEAAVGRSASFLQVYGSAAVALFHWPLILLGPVD